LLLSNPEFLFGVSRINDKKERYNHMVQILEGHSLAQARKERLLSKAHQLTISMGRPPKLAVILVGNDPSSHTYVTYKAKMCAELNIESVKYLLDKSIQQVDLMDLIHDLNRHDMVDGILLQLPLPSHLDAKQAILAIDPHKDVDGLHPLNQGLLLQGDPFMIPCTPKGCLDLIHACCDLLKGVHAVVVGRSVLVGKPLAALLINHDATVTLAHSKTSRLQEVCRTADILISAIGKPGIITGDYIKQGAIVIDVGQTHVDNKIRGDVDHDTVAPKASFLTPARGGVGPMTIINLMENVLHAAEFKITE
jgi:methylenetetrahydrofolate dehydrogenase (NADP+)/methenyltetrahydrofolate cyclohydrolase